MRVPSAANPASRTSIASHAASAAASPEASPATTDEPIGEEAVLDCHAPGTPRADDKSYAAAAAPVYAPARAGRAAAARVGAAESVVATDVIAAVPAGLTPGGVA